MPPLALPPTSAYPSDPTALERERLDALYLELSGPPLIPWTGP